MELGHVDVVKGVPLFEGVTAQTLAQHGLRPTSLSLKAGQTLIMVGEPLTKVWFLRSGWARLLVHSPAGHEATTTIIGPGEMLGYLGGAGTATSPCTAAALTDATAVSFLSSAFERWLRSDARAACRVIDVLARRLSESARLKAINAERAETRLQLTLGWLAEKFGPDIPATRSLLADLTGLRAETCSRALSTLRRRGVLDVFPGLIRVLQPRRLGRERGR